MALSEKAKKNKNKYIMEYAKEKYKRVPLDLKQDYYDAVKAFLDQKKIPVNTYIKKALNEKLVQDGFVYIPQDGFVYVPNESDPALSPDPEDDKMNL